ncbi:hypothetical protein HYX14_04220 [Candidatus Woesearchaeota archaeon]|nr:hypothetical protein [Candidatus Woesearchaeota archaeon]
MFGQYFWIRENKQKLRQMLQQCGFKEESVHNLLHYRADDVAIGFPDPAGERDLQRRQQGESFLCVELAKDLAEYDDQHPLRQFFAQLQNAEAEGEYGLLPKYSANDFLPLEYVFPSRSMTGGVKFL